MSTRRHRALSHRALPQPTALAACLAATFAIAAPAALASTDVALPPIKAAAVALAHAHAKSTRPPTTQSVSNCNDGGAGTLRDAMNHAADSDTIDLSQLTCSRITLTTGALVASVDNLTLQGPANHHLTIDGGYSGHHYNNAIIHGGAGLLTLNDVIITDAKYQDGDGLGGCIWSNGSVYLHRSIITNCGVSNSTTGNASGGGVWARKNVLSQFSTVSDNRALASDGDAYGGGIYAKGAVDTFYSTISGNIANGSGLSKGGGVFVIGSIGVSNATFSGNRGGFGGALFIDGTGVTFEPQIRNSTISGNIADNSGGGIFTRVAAYLFSNTIVLNTEAHLAGAGVYFEQDSSFSSNIILGNTVTGSGGTEVDVGGAANTHATCSHNLLNSFAIISLPAGCFVPGENSDFGPLGDHGGPTRTHSLPPGSAAINAGSASATSWDQRGPGFARSALGADIGAYEYDPDIIFANGFN